MRVLVVGVSAVARENYLPYLAARADVELVLYNRTTEVATEAAAIYGAEVATDWASAAAGVDIAFVLTTEVPRHALVSDLIAAGVPRIFCEKPFVARDGQHVDVEDFQAGAELLGRAEAAGVELAQQFNYRWMAPVATALAAVEEHGLGELRTFSLRSHFGCWAHVIDLAEFLTGGIAEIRAAEGLRREGHGVVAEDVAVALRTRSGLVGTLLGTVSTSWERPLYWIDAIYEHGSVAFGDFAEPVQLVVGDQLTVLESTPVRPRWDQYRASFAASLDAYFVAVAAGSPAPVRGADGVAQLRLEAGIRLSAETGTAIVLDEALPFTPGSVPPPAPPAPGR